MSSNNNDIIARLAALIGCLPESLTVENLAALHATALAMWKVAEFAPHCTKRADAHDALGDALYVFNKLI